MKTLLIIHFFVFATIFVSAQVVISTAGETQKISGFEISWTIGEPLIETISAENTILTQGFHQSKLTVTAIEEITNINLKVYPNPTSEFITIQFNTLEKNPDYSLLDFSGKLLEHKTISASTTNVNLKNLASGTYLLKIDDKNARQLQTFKIIKK
jgi:hypothetical protein